MDNRQPIVPLTMYRSILGRANGYRGNRIIPIEGTIVGLPFDPLDSHKERNLMRQALDFGPDKETAIKVYISRVNETTSAFDGRQAAKAGVDYLNATFVEVQEAGTVNGTTHTCLHLIITGECPDVDFEEYIYDSENDVTMSYSPDGSSVESIYAYSMGDDDDDDYGILVEGQHYNVVNGEIIISHDNWLFMELEEDGDQIGLEIMFDVEGCDPVDVIVTREDPVDTDDDDDEDTSV